MTCQEWIELLGDHFDGDLASELEDEFGRHMEGCAECFAYLSSYRTTVRMGREVHQDSETDPCAAVPEEMVQAILKAMKSS